MDENEIRLMEKQLKEAKEKYKNEKKKEFEDLTPEQKWENQMEFIVNNWTSGKGVDETNRADVIKFMFYKIKELSKK